MTLFYEGVDQMAKIDDIKNRLGETIYPRTLTRAIYEEGTNRSLDDLLFTKGQTLANVSDDLVAHKAEIVSQAEPNKIPRALEGGKLDLGWIPRFMPNIQVFETNGTFVVPDGVIEIFVELVGGGGAGQGTDKTSYLCSGGGGGGYSAKLIKDIPPLSQIPITVGLGGTGNGGTSSFGSYVSATGGKKGTEATLSGLAGVGVGGDINLNGQEGGWGGAKSAAPNGNGGSSYFGGGAVVPGSNNNGNPGVVPGTGGSGSNNANTTMRSGGRGANGIVIVRW